MRFPALVGILLIGLVSSEIKPSFQKELEKTMTNEIPLSSITGKYKRDTRAIVVVCEGNSVRISCGRNRVIHVKYASYGRKDKMTCPSKYIKTTSCSATRSFSTISKACNGRHQCTLLASNSVFGDPCYGTFKYLTVIYSYETIQQLVRTAVAAKQNAYCPYSNFRVGAAVLTEDGSIFSGANVENASYGLSICAERVAIMNAVSKGQRKLSSAAVSCDIEESFQAPCGACRQFFAEFNVNLDLYLTKPDLTIQKVKISDLLPMAFTPDTLALKRN